MSHAPAGSHFQTKTLKTTKTQICPLWHPRKLKPYHQTTPPLPLCPPTQTVAGTCSAKCAWCCTSPPQSRHGAAPWPNEKQSEETGNNPRQAPAGRHKKRGCLSPHAFSFNSTGWWKINGPTGGAAAEPVVRRSTRKRVNYQTTKRSTANVERSVFCEGLNGVARYAVRAFLLSHVWWVQPFAASLTFEKCWTFPARGSYSKLFFNPPTFPIYPPTHPSLTLL